MPLEPLSLVVLLVLGGVVAVDGTSFGQLMISRPLIASTLAGAAVGDPLSGAMIGLVLEAFNLNILPVGAAKYPEGGPAAVVGGSVYATMPGDHIGMLLVTVLTVLGLEWLGGESIRLLRMGNRRWVPVDGEAEVDADRLQRGHMIAIGVDFLRGMLLVAFGMLVLSILVRNLTPLWGLGERIPEAAVAAIIAGLLASSLRIVGPRGWFTFAGAIAGLTLLLVT